MILKESRDLEWIQELRSRYQFTNPTLIEKTIRAFSLLEALSVSGCPFLFKGGTALMLHLNSAKRRFSILTLRLTWPALLSLQPLMLS